MLLLQSVPAMVGAGAALVTAIGVGGYLIVHEIAESTAKEVAEEALMTTAEDAARSALMQELVKDEFVQFLVDNVKEDALPSINQNVKELNKTIDKKYAKITDDLKDALITLEETTKEVTDERIKELEQADEDIKKSNAESTQAINDFINLSLTDLVPSGCIAAFYCNPAAPPSGWLACDGRTISSDPSQDVDHKPDVKYARLVSILTGLGYGEGINIAVLPDLRGRFLRGVQGKMVVGGYEPDTIKGHKHPIYGEAQVVGRSLPETERGRYRNYLTEIRSWSIPAPEPVFKDTEFQGRSSEDHQSFKPEVAVETRPKNISVVWCIKY